MKFKTHAFRMRTFNQETLEEISARLNYGYNDELLPDIIEIMNKWVIELEKLNKIKK